LFLNKHGFVGRTIKRFLIQCPITQRDKLCQTDCGQIL
jgi:hypothetical protein